MHQSSTTGDGDGDGAVAASSAAVTYSNNNNNNEVEKQSKNREEEEDDHHDRDVGFPIHSQVMKIKQEIEKLKQPSLQQGDMRRLLLRNITRQRSRSPLGFSERTILVNW